MTPFQIAVALLAVNTTATLAIAWCCWRDW